MFIAALSTLSVGASSVRTAVKRQELRYNDMAGKPAPRKIATCWCCERSIALKPGFRSYHCESCDVAGSAEPAFVRGTLAERKYYLFVGCDGQTRLEHYVEHSDSSLPSPA
jgi:hypothetical protein